MKIQLRQAETAADLEEFRRLCQEYARSLEYTAECASLEHQGIACELETLPGRYAPPGGVILLAFGAADSPLGCAALRPLEPRVCEMKRMYVRMQARGMGIGRMLAEQLIGTARRLGYERMRLDTGASMTAAAALYEALGFRDIPPYNRDPTPGTRWMELRL